VSLRARESRILHRVRPRLRAVYCDLDGTLVGLGGSLLHDGEGRISTAGVRAAEACLRAGVELVLTSGRRRETVAQPARLLGQGSFVYEAGAVVVLDGEEHWLTGDFTSHDERTTHDLVEETGAPALLLDHFAGRLEYHDPWHVGRTVSHLFRGDVDALEADALLAEHGHAGLRLVDNGGAVGARMDGIESLRAYQLVPRAVSKATGVAFHRRARGYAAEECIAVGDSREDLGMAGVVGRFWLVANALERDPTLRDALTPNVRIAGGRHGEGVYEAVVTELAERR
jgi:hydroxymethylpyrimidine pyrophosphatase-like HAD family hydrolase